MNAKEDAKELRSLIHLEPRLAGIAVRIELTDQDLKDLQSQNERLVEALEEWTTEYLRMMTECRETGYSDFNCNAGMVSRSLTLLTEIKKG